ncbi:MULTISPECIES: Lsr2 family protein [unclassified Microbacterium]|uniref:histone-like nucleoid-structuring protein Lsr2 n=2 Tax=Microbacterium TaxID=33882 RepID=UPI0025CCA2C1|nr:MULTISPECIES: Lsr2 family protein [unclassified Microbacterium]
MTDRFGGVIPRVKSPIFHGIRARSGLTISSMAKKQITQLIDDLDGSVIDDGTTIHFSVEGRAYEIDLSPENATKLRAAFEPFVSAGRALGSVPAGPRRATKTRSGSARDLGDVRTWAEENGYSINTRGRISATILEAYDAAH